MKKLVSILILCLACLGGLKAQNYWEFIDHSSTLLGVAPDGSMFFHQGNSGIARMQIPNGACPIVIGPQTGFTYYFNPNCFCVSPEGRIFLFNNGLNAVMYSDDNGDTWQQMPQVSSCAMDEVAGLYAPSNETVVGWSPTGEIFWTTDNGVTWEEAIPDIMTTNNGPLIGDLLVSPNGDVYLGISTVDASVGIWQSTLSDMQNWQPVAGLGDCNVCDMEFDPEGNVVACGWRMEGSIGFMHTPSFYLVEGTSLAVSNSGVVYTPSFAGHSAVLSYSLDHGETFVNVGEDIPLVDIAPGDGSGYLFKGYDNYLYFVSGTEYWKSIPNADEIPTFNPLVGVKFYDEASRLYYIITSDNTVEVTYDRWHFNTYVGDYVVPETVTYEGVTYTVTAIGELAFGGCEGELNSVIVPNTVTTIRQSAFASSPRLRTVVLPNSVESIGIRTFSLCSRLTSVRLPEGITELPDFIFEGCESLTSFTIPSTVTHIGESAFNNSGIVINSIPESVTSIGNNAFYYCEGIRSMVIPNSVTSLGWGVFAWCRELQSIQLPDNLEAIPATFLKNCFALSSITIPESVTSIGEEAFSGCTHLTSVVIPEAVTSMGNGVFRNCYNLASVDMPETLDYLGEKAFRECSRLTSITLPRNLTKLCNEVFEGCSALHQIEIPESVTSIGNWAFGDCNLEEVVIPNQVDSIGLNAFAGCQGLSHVVLGTSVSYLGEYALNTVVSVGDSLIVECLGTTPPRCGYTTFPDAALQGRMIVPCGYENIYCEALGEYWASGNFEEDCEEFEGLCEAPNDFGGWPIANEGTYGAFLTWNQPLGGHWFHYDENPYAGSVYCDYWGIRIPAEEIQSGDVLTKVAFYKAGCHDQTAHYVFAFAIGGESEPGNLEFLPGNSVQVEPGPDGWVTVDLHNPIDCEEGQSLWIVLHAPNIMGNNAPYCEASGNPDACWSNTGNVVGDWMIRGYFNNWCHCNDNFDHYNVYRGNTLEELEKIAEVGRDEYLNGFGEVEYFDTLQQPFGDYYYQLTASYNDGCESEPAQTYVYFHVGNISSLGSEWYYEIQNENGSITYQHLEYVADTTINHKDVKIIIRTNTLYDKGEHSEVTREYIYEDFGKVYWWNETLQDFTLLYNLGAQVGENWIVNVGDQSITMHVDAVEQYEYEGQAFRMLTVSDEGNLFSGHIVSGIGHLTSFFPERLMQKGKGHRVEGIRCYWREGELIFKYGDRDCDEVYEEWHNGIEEDGPSAGSGVFTVYPNPTDGVLFVETFPETSLHVYRIMNLFGQTLMTGQITAETQQINVSNLPQGMYFISVGDMTQKFVVR